MAAKYVYCARRRCTSHVPRHRGRLTGGTRLCQMDGCGGTRYGVRWPNGRITWPCVKGMKARKNGDWEIL